MHHHAFSLGKLVPALLLLAAALVAVAVLRRRGQATVPGPARTAPPAHGVPAPREIWWAEVPFEDGPGAKDRPCLVLRVHGRTATVMKITSKHHERPGVLPLPRGAVGDRQERDSWLETDELREVPLAHFRRRAGQLDSRIWARVSR